MLNKTRVGIKSIIILLVAVLLLNSCGGIGVNNDQGVSLSAFGFFSDSSCTTNQQNLTVALAETGSESTPTSGSVSSFISLSNNMTSQAFRVDGVYLDYQVAGSSTSVPSTTAIMNGLLGPAASTSTDTTGDTTGGDTTNTLSSLPDSFSDISNTGCMEVLVVPEDIREWLLFNKASLPEAPYTLIVTATVTGVTTAGNRINANPVSLFVEVTSNIGINGSSN